MLTKFFHTFLFFLFFFQAFSPKKVDGKFTAEEQGHIKATSGKVIQQRRK